MANMLDQMIPDFNPNKVVQQQSPCGHDHGPPQQQQNTPFQQPEPWPAAFPNPIIGIERNGIITSKGLEIIEESLNAIKMIRQKKYKLVLISDERGKTEQQGMSDLNTLMNNFGRAGIQNIDNAYFSISTDKADQFVKPSTGMFKRAAKEVVGADWNKGWYLGVTINDLKAAYKVGATPVLIKTPYFADTLNKLNSFSNKDLKKKTKTFNSLLEFATSLK